MALPANYLIVRAIYGTPDKDPMINIMWYQQDAPSAEPWADAAVYANAFYDEFQPKYTACLTTFSAFLAVTVALSNNGNVFNATSTQGQQLGVVTEDELPSFCACCIQKRTNSPGKQGRGRWFIGGVPETFSNEGKLTGPATTNYAILGASLGASQSFAEVPAVTACLYSPFDDALYPILSTAVVQNLATQRRRRLRQAF